MRIDLQELAKAMILNRDPAFGEVIRRDCEAGFGPALYLMGVVEARGTFHPKNVEQAICYFSLPARDHHLTSEFLA